MITGINSLMLTRVIISAIIAMISLAGFANAQVNQGLPELHAIPRTGRLHNKHHARHFRFIAAGDNRPASAKSAQPPTLSRIFKDARRFKPVFFLWSGDIIYGHKVDRDVLSKQYKEFFRIAQGGHVPVFNAPGNHEMDVADKTSGETIETPNSQLQALYLEFMEFPAGAPPYGAFDFGNSRFIALDTEEVAPAGASRSEGPTVASGTKLDPGFVSPRQVDLLKNDLEAHKDKAHIFVFMHHPIKPLKSKFGLNSANAQELEQLFSQYPNVSYVISAHEHLFYNASQKSLKLPVRTDPSASGPFYVVSGGAGAPLDTCKGQPDNCGEFNHYIVFDVKDHTVKARVVQVRSAKPRAPAGKEASTP
jgi:3',5'-cyclic AMP phosphodiesterase CpdA